MLQDVLNQSNLSYEDIKVFGNWFRGIILLGAELLREEWTPGIVSFLMVVSAVIAILYLRIRDWRRQSALGWARHVVSMAEDRRDFAEKLVDVDRAFASARDAGHGKYRRPLGIAWSEYRETMVIPAPESGDPVRNNLRPDVFFGAQDLGFEPGWWRLWPGLFISVGLFLTFLGLIAALTSIGGGGITDNSLRGLLNAASAKFIMSLTGLACSILITVTGRRSTSAVERGIRDLCHALERRLQFQGLEEIAAAQLAAVKEQGTAMRQVAMEMVAELSRPLREELPAAIGVSIREQVAPLMERLGQTSEQGVGQMVGDLSQQLSRDIGEAMALASARLGQAADRLAALTERMESGAARIGSEYETIAERLGSQMTEMQRAMQSEVANGQQAMSDGMERLMQQLSRDIGEAMALASTRLGEAADRLAALTERMESGAGRIGSEYETIAERLGSQMAEMQRAMQSEAANGQQAMSDGMERLMQQMNESLDAIRTNTSEGARAISDAAAAMRDAATNFRQELESATGTGAAAVNAQMKTAAQAAGASIASATESLTTPLAELSERLQAAAQATQTGADGLARLAEAVRSGGNAITRGSDRFAVASGAMAEAAEPIRAGIDGMRATSRDMVESFRQMTEVALKHSETTARQTRDALEAATGILEGQRKGISDAMEGLAVALAELKGHGDRLDTIDQKLGAAFDTYREQVQATISGTADQVRAIVEILNPALATMQAIVEQAEEFAPQSQPPTRGGGRH